MQWQLHYCTCRTCGRTVRQPDRNLFWLCVCKPVVSSCCFRERSTAWPSPSQTDHWWRRSLEGSWTVSTALRTPVRTATTWTATVKPTEVGVGSPGPDDNAHTGNQAHLREEVRVDGSMVALSCIPTLNGKKEKKKHLQRSDAQAIVILIRPERYHVTQWESGTRKKKWLVPNTVLVFWFDSFNGVVVCVCPTLFVLKVHFSSNFKCKCL